MRSDFTKVERILEEGLRKMSIKQLLKLADLAAGMGSKGSQTNDSLHTPSETAIIIKNELNWLEKQDPEIYKKLGIKRKDIRFLLEHPHKIKEQEFVQLAQLKVKLDEHKKAILEKLAGNSDDKLIDQAREKHINKRFNVNERWLPLK